MTKKAESAWSVDGESVIRAARVVVEGVGFKRAADLLGRPRPVLSQALHADPAQRNGQHLYLEHTVTLIRLDSSERFVSTILAASEPEFSEREQLVALLEAAFEVLGPEVNRLIHEKAHLKLLGRRRAVMRTRGVGVAGVGTSKKEGGVL